MTNIDRGGIRSILAETGGGIIAGFGVQSYVPGLQAMLGHLRGRRKPRSRPARKRGPSRSGR